MTDVIHGAERTDPFEALGFVENSCVSILSNILYDSRVFLFKNMMI